MSRFGLPPIECEYSNPNCNYQFYYGNGEYIPIPPRDLTDPNTGGHGHSETENNGNSLTQTLAALENNTSGTSLITSITQLVKDYPQATLFVAGLAVVLITKKK